MIFMAAKIQNSYEKVYLLYMSFVVGDTIMSFSTFTSDMYTKLSIKNYCCPIKFLDWIKKQG